MSGNTSKRYPLELRERAVRMVAEIRVVHESEWAAMTRVSELLGVGHAGNCSQVGSVGAGRGRRAAGDNV
jgi:transposase-like protein